MGSSKSNTGIGFIDNAVDYSVNNIVNPAAKNTEQAYGRVAQGVGAMATGNFNNAGNTLLEVSGLGLGAPLLGYKAGETPLERKQRETVAKVQSEDAAKAAADAQAAIDKKQSDINTTVSEIVQSRRRQPGRAATLLTTVGQGTSYGPLLNARGR